MNWKQTRNSLLLYLYILEASFIIDTFQMLSIWIYFIKSWSILELFWSYEIFSLFMNHLSSLVKWNSSPRWASLDSFKVEERFDFGTVEKLTRHLILSQLKFACSELTIEALVVVLVSLLLILNIYYIFF